MENELKTYGLVQFSTKTGKVKTVMTAKLVSLLRLWALNNCKPTDTIYVFDLTERKYNYIVRGNKTGYPHILDCFKQVNFDMEEEFDILFEDEL